MWFFDRYSHFQHRTIEKQSNGTYSQITHNKLKTIHMSNNMYVEF